ncbi:aminodeoxychorismate synthase component I [Desulfopila aestuarii]|uniref:Para-aminobenzoate synthetase / 4-amino-4-deoxychorismate lyase n=1 Tax=Desulfopila aestuarii DSM 18488 TaxID=1121416 RepID=A0A1M7XZ17_9BACT|nr:aminodeoxychorismate synthase component I [Desulfopila aestuarii]SHO44389.1 para-aminobenzoate synthetase / 4-amino-4-deoxychorismate lyase [Desulfopila aestuarii DSM 18488]
MYIVSNMLLERLLGHFAQTEQFAFFDTAKPCQENCSSYLFESPIARLQCGGEDDPEQFLEMVQKWLERGYYIAGWVGYEFGGMLVRKARGLTSVPQKKSGTVADLSVYEKPLQFDHKNGNCDFPQETPLEFGDYEISGIRPNVTEDEYLEALDAVLEYIRAGDTYQVNYTLKLLFSLSGSHDALYRVLRRNQSVAYGAYLRWGDRRVMSFSPELFFRRHADGLTVRPMKGTLKRGRNPEEDAAARAFLYQDQKNRSENVMIVDLLRNDLGRVMHDAGGGEVKVRSLFDVEAYESLLQMTSTIDGKTEEGAVNSVSLVSLFQALFPCGSVTGAPKIRTMEIIDELEKESRGVYTGAIGFLSPEGEAVFNVPIRTLVFDGNSGEMGIGGGITHDSDPHDEWKECLLKGRFLTSPSPDFQLIETLLWRPGLGYWLMDEHLERLAASAEYFYFSYDRDQLIQQLETQALTFEDVRRVRLTLAKDGVVTITSQPCELPKHTRLPDRPDLSSYATLPTVAFSTLATDASQCWLMHKTTRRKIYDQGFAAAQKAGYFDQIFVNDKGEVTEGSITNVVIYREGSYLTPPVSCGLLAGVMRKQLLADPSVKVEERILFPTDIFQAEAVFLVNSVRGVVQVKIEK